jgi:hypothetical protein
VGRRRERNLGHGRDGQFALQRGLVGCDPVRAAFLRSTTKLCRQSNFDAGFGSAHGALTWRSGGGSGRRSRPRTRLVGSASNDNIGSGGVVALSNGNYVVRSRLWNNGGTSDAGAVTWGNGTTGISGTISAANSLIGANSNDQAGSGGVIALSGGRYLVSTPGWNNGGSFDAGAVTLASAAGDTAGTITTANSMIGSTRRAIERDRRWGEQVLARSTANRFVLVR